MKSESPTILNSLHWMCGTLTRSLFEVIRHAKRTNRRNIIVTENETTFQKRPNLIIFYDGIVRAMALPTYSELN